MTCGWTGVCRPVFRNVPLLITETCGHTHFYDEFWRKTTHFLLFFANFWMTHPCLRKICRKKDPFLENLGPKNPPIWAAHTRTLNMLCTPPPGLSYLLRCYLVSLKYDYRPKTQFQKYRNSFISWTFPSFSSRCFPH